MPSRPTPSLVVPGAAKVGRAEHLQACSIQGLPRLCSGYTLGRVLSCCLHEQPYLTPGNGRQAVTVVVLSGRNPPCMATCSNSSFYRVLGGHGPLQLPVLHTQGLYGCCGPGL